MAEVAQGIKRVVVVGAGIGGLTTANALLKRGFEVVVLERAASFCPTAGAGFGFSPNGQACLHSIGIPKERLDTILHPLTAQTLLARDLKPLVRSDALKLMLDKYGLGIGATLRADLVDILAEPLLTTGVLRYSQTVVKVDGIEGPGRPSVTLASGEVVEGDLVVGADGINSLVASAVLGAEHDAPIFTNENIFYGVIDPPPAPEGELGAPHQVVQCFDRGEFICFRAGGEGKQKLIWAMTHGAKTPPDRAEWGRAGAARRELEALISQKYSPEHPAIKLLAQTPDERLLYFGLFYRRHKSRWHRGRAVLLGDSCHATLPFIGQGANQAIEDAIVLAQCLDKARSGDVEVALQSYYNQRHKRTERVVNTSWYLGKFMHAEGWLTGLARDWIMKWLIGSGTIYRKLGEKELVEHCPVPIPVVNPNVRI